MRTNNCVRIHNACRPCTSAENAQLGFEYVKILCAHIDLVFLLPCKINRVNEIFLMFFLLKCKEASSDTVIVEVKRLLYEMG